MVCGRAGCPLTNNPTSAIGPSGLDVCAFYGAERTIYVPKNIAPYALWFRVLEGSTIWGAGLWWGKFVEKVHLESGVKSEEYDDSVWITLNNVCGMRTVQGAYCAWLARVMPRLHLAGHMLPDTSCIHFIVVSTCWRQHVSLIVSATELSPAVCRPSVDDSGQNENKGVSRQWPLFTKLLGGA